MFYDYLDIGTANFKTSLEVKKDNEKIILVDPIKTYLDELDNGPFIYKENAAIGNIDGFIDVTYINPQVIKLKNLKSWIGGSTQVGSIHPVITKMINQKVISKNDLIKTKVPLITFSTLQKKYNIDEVYQIKIDTEGYESIILNSIYNAIDLGFIANRIIFEYRSELSNLKMLDILVEKFQKKGYKTSWYTKKKRDILLEKI